MSSDQDLKLGDTLRYYQRDSNAAKALLVRRLRCLGAYETANRNLERARSKNKDVHAVSPVLTTPKTPIRRFSENMSVFFTNTDVYVLSHFSSRFFHKYFLHLNYTSKSSTTKNRRAANGSARGRVLCDTFSLVPITKNVCVCSRETFDLKKNEFSCGCL